MKEITIITTVEVTDTIKLEDEYAEEFLLKIKENHATERALKKVLGSDDVKLISLQTFIREEITDEESERI